MSNNKTVFVIGAGASADLGLPTGHELKNNIAKLLDLKLDDFGMKFLGGDNQIINALIRHNNNNGNQPGYMDKLIKACQHIRDAMPQADSIDNFINDHKDDKYIELCGKLAITRAILQAEKGCGLSIDEGSFYGRLGISKVEDKWYNEFFKLLTYNCVEDDLLERVKSVALIVFNYDRCVEHYLFYALQNYYKISDDFASKLINSIEIYHPYGTVGLLPSQAPGNHVKFGAEVSPENLFNIAKKIKTFTEGTDEESSDITAIRKNISDSSTIVYLGFAYHKLNMELMMSGITTKNKKGVRHLGTATALSASDQEHIERHIFQLSNGTIPNITLEPNMDCTVLLNNYRRSLSLS